MDDQELLDQGEEANAYLARIAIAAERARDYARIIALSTGLIAGILLVALVIVAVLALTGQLDDDGARGWR